MILFATVNADSTTGSWKWAGDESPCMEKTMLKKYGFGFDVIVSCDL